MSCDLTIGRAEPCKDAIGGIKAVYFINFGDVTGLTYDTTGSVTDEVTNLGALTAYKWEVLGAGNSLEETINSSRDNGTTIFEQVVNLQLKKMDSESTQQVKILAYGRPYIVVEDYNGNSRIAGVTTGCDLTGGTITTGTAKTDLNGYTLVFTGQEGRPAPFLQGAVADDPFAGMTDTVTVVLGTNS